MMPLEPGTSKAAFAHNIAAELKAGKPLKQAVAIAYSKKGEGRDAARPLSFSGQMSVDDLKATLKAAGKSYDRPDQSRGYYDIWSLGGGVKAWESSMTGTCGMGRGEPWRNGDSMSKARDTLTKVLGRTKDSLRKIGTAAPNWGNPLNFKGVRYELRNRPDNELPGGEETKIYMLDDVDEASASTPLNIQVTKRGEVYTA